MPKQRKTIKSTHILHNTKIYKKYILIIESRSTSQCLKMIIKTIFVSLLKNVYTFTHANIVDKRNPFVSIEHGKENTKE